MLLGISLCLICAEAHHIGSTSRYMLLVSAKIKSNVAGVDSV